jgi:hypothetical protein
MATIAPQLIGKFTGLLCDLLWSDPDKDITGWSENDRGVSFTFGPDVVSRFLQKHDMDLICRAHQVYLLTEGLAHALNVPLGCGRRIRVFRQTTSGDTVLGAKLLWRIRQCGSDDERG